MKSLSIIIPTYNNADLLARAVSSAFAFAGSDSEVIVVDDGSTDKTSAVVTELCVKFPNLKHYGKANGGLSSARNYGISMATGKYVVLLDADDELIAAPTLDFLELAPDMVRVGVEEFTLGEGVTVHAEPYTATTGPEYLARTLADRTFYTPSWAYFYRRDWLQAQGLSFADGLLHEDMLFTPAALLRCQSLVVTASVLYRYHRRPDSISQAVNERHLERRIHSLELVSRRITELANEHRRIDLGWWALDIIDYAASLASLSARRRPKWGIFWMELRFFLKCRAWGVFREPRDVRFRVRQRARAWLQNRQYKAADA